MTGSIFTGEDIKRIEENLEDDTVAWLFVDRDAMFVEYGYEE